MIAFTLLLMSGAVVARPSRHRSLQQGRHGSFQWRQALANAFAGRLQSAESQQQLLMKMEVVMFDFVCSQPLLIVLVCAQVKYGEVDGEK